MGRKGLKLTVSQGNKGTNPTNTKALILFWAALLYTTNKQHQETTQEQQQKIPLTLLTQSHVGLRI
jgi:hypothetical protein